MTMSGEELTLECVPLLLDESENLQRPLFRLICTHTPRKAKVCVLLDCSDSYDKALADVAALRKAIHGWPDDWAVSFYRLSSPSLLMTQTIGQFCRGECRIEHHVEGMFEPIPTQSRGSFLRPCLEAIEKERSLEGLSSDRIVLVLGDGRFTDIVTPLIPSWTEITVICPQVVEDQNEQITYTHWGTRQLNAIFERHRRKLGRELIIGVQSLPKGTRVFNCFDGTLQRWASGTECVIDRDNPPAWILVDCTVDVAANLTWWLRSRGTVQALQIRMTSTICTDSVLSLAVIESLRHLSAEQSWYRLLECDEHDPDFDKAWNFFLAAENAANDRKFWQTEGLDKRLLEMLTNRNRLDEQAIDSIVMIGCRADPDNSPNYLLAIGLSKTDDVRMRKGHRIGRCELEDDIFLTFDRERRRWLFGAGDSANEELGISSQRIKMPIRNSSTGITVVFAKLGHQ